MLPDVSAAIDAWSQEIELQTVTQTVVDFLPVNNIVSTYPMAVVQPADKEKLTPGIVDYSLKYIQIHSKVQINVGDFVVYQSIKYKIIPVGHFSDYGYTEATGEEVK